MNQTLSTDLSIRTTIAVVLLISLGAVMPSRASVQTFNDVAIDYWAYSFIEIFAANGITAGCGGGNYCPEDSVTRAQMAVFLERGMNGSSYVPQAATGNVFLDVRAEDFAASFIEQLASDGVTAGCGNNNYCPGVEVTRDQMAVFLLRAKYGSSYSPPTPTGEFADVPLNHWAVGWIEQLASEGITTGCGGGNYCPNSPVSRDQMAVFMVRTFDLKAAPNLTVHFPLSSGVTDVANFTIRGSAADSNGGTVDWIRIRSNSGSILVALQPTAMEWMVEVPLSDGVNNLTVEATDANGVTSTDLLQIRKDLFLDAIITPIYIAQRDKIYFTARDAPNTQPSGPDAIVELDSDSGVRRIVSGNGVGTGPNFAAVAGLIENTIDGSIFVFDDGIDSVVHVDLSTGARSITVDMSAVSSSVPDGLVVDIARNRLLTMYGNDLWEYSFSTEILSHVTQLDVLNVSLIDEQALQISADNNTLFFNSHNVLMRIDADTYAVSETALVNPSDSLGFFVDESNNSAIYGAFQNIYVVELGSGTSLGEYLVPGEAGQPEYISRGRTGAEVLAVDSKVDRILALDYENDSYEVLGGSTRGRGVSIRSGFIALLGNPERLLSVSLGPFPSNLDYGLLEIDPITGDRVLTDIGSFLDPAGGGPVSDAATSILDFGKGRTDDEIYWLSGGQQALYSIAPATGAVTVVANFQGDSRPGRFCVDAENSAAYLVDFNSDRVIALDLNTGDFATLSSFNLQIGAGPQVNIQDIVCDNSGNRILGIYQDSVVAIDYQTGNRSVVISQGQGIGPTFAFGFAMAASQDGTELYVGAVPDGGAGFTEMLRVNLTDGSRETVLKNPDPRNFEPSSMELASNRLAYVVDAKRRVWSLDLLSGERLLISH